jgi:predicted nucleic acid-binding protein
MLGSARLLTGDKTLRKRAEGEGINVSGILFVFDELVNHNIISPKDAAAHLAELYESNVRLPKEEVEKRLEQWK